jgi:hypothetical protein
MLTSSNLVFLERSEHGAATILDVGTLMDKLHFISFNTDAICMKHRHYLKTLTLDCTDCKYMFAGEERIVPILDCIRILAHLRNKTLEGFVVKLIEQVKEAKVPVLDLSSLENAQETWTEQKKEIM